MHILDGWKEIANHLHKSVRTVQRFELFGLPIHRARSGNDGHVFAFMEEVDLWHEAAPVRLKDEIGEMRKTIDLLTKEVHLLKRKLGLKRR